MISGCVVSFGDGNDCNPNKNNYNTNIYLHRTWIKDTIYELSNIDIYSYPRYSEIDKDAEFDANSDAVESSGCSLSLL